MSLGISENYQAIEPGEVPAAAARLDSAWQDSAIPLRQWISCVRGEVERFRDTGEGHHFAVLIRALRQIGAENPSLLDVGAASGYYGEIIRVAGLNVKYTAFDYSQDFARLAKELWPGIDFKVGDARRLPFSNNSFDIVMSGACLMHVIQEYPAVIREAARVARTHVIFHRTAILTKEPTAVFIKDAYGIPVAEVHIGESELLQLFADSGLKVIGTEDVFFDEASGFGHRTYLTTKESNSGRPL